VERPAHADLLEAARAVDDFVSEQAFDEDRVLARGVRVLHLLRAQIARAHAEHRRVDRSTREVVHDGQADFADDEIGSGGRAARRLRVNQ
jgi:hypothetical protein